MEAAESSAGISWLSACRGVLRRDLTLALRRRTDTLACLIFFGMVVSLFPLGIGPEANVLRNIGPGVVWVAALLASMLALNRLFFDDHQDGTLEQLVLSPAPLPLLVLSKAVAHWASSGLLLVLASPVIAIQFDLSATATGVLCLTLLLGTPVLSLVGSIGAALTVGVRGAGVLVSLLVLPLVMPVLIFGASAVQDSAAGMPVTGHFSLLGAMLLASIVLAPLATAGALRISLE